MGDTISILTDGLAPLTPDSSLMDRRDKARQCMAEELVIFGERQRAKWGDVITSGQLCECLEHRLSSLMNMAGT